MTRQQGVSPDHIEAWAKGRRGAELEHAQAALTVPPEVADAAARIRADVREAIDVCYGELGGKDDTPEDVENTTRVIADDMRAILDWVATLPRAASTP